MSLLRTTFVGLLVTLLPAATQASITITSNYTVADARIGNGSIVEESFSGTDIPTYAGVVAAAGHLAYSRNTIDWSTSGGQTILSFHMSHRRGGSQYSYAQTYDSVLNFVATSNSLYELSGHYHVTDGGTNDSGRVRQWAYLYDTTAGGYLFQNLQTSRATHDEQFTLGALGGDYENHLSGSLTGNLIAGHTYQLYFSKYTYAWPEGDSGAHAVGNITLKIAELTTGVIPEPLSHFVWGGLIVCAIRARPARTDSEKCGGSPL